ncbi:Panacea domain-containing protein [Rhizobium johnstonii]|uniref:Panacea domain-containing protein n=1 Tax=Rhizobium johnstonii TaxID=3019933 RepID=UPI003F9AC441
MEITYIRAMTIQFKFAAGKAYAAIHWMVSRHPGIDLHAALKAFYFADKSHLNEQRRPIFGASYKAMKFGPVPLEIYEMMKGEALWKAELGREEFPWELAGYHLRSMTNSEPDMDSFSESDVEHLERGLSQSLEMSFTERTAATHGPDWQHANLGRMRYEDMLEDGPHKSEIVAYLEANARYMRL